MIWSLPEFDEYSIAFSAFLYHYQELLFFFYKKECELLKFVSEEHFMDVFVILNPMKFRTEFEDDNSYLQTDWL